MKPSGIEELVCEDIAQRQQLGIAKYGTTVAGNPLELKQWLQHAYEEALDMAVYLRRAINEIERKQQADEHLSFLRVKDLRPLKPRPESGEY